MTKAFVTGGTGFLGGRLIRMLVNRGWQVRALHRTPGDAAKLAALGAVPVPGDLDSVEAVLRWAAVGGPLPTDLSGLAFAQVRR